jgi:hypothetical protein
MAHESEILSYAFLRYTRFHRLRWVGMPLFEQRRKPVRV